MSIPATLSKGQLIFLRAFHPPSHVGSQGHIPVLPLVYQLPMKHLLCVENHQEALEWWWGVRSSASTSSRR